MREEFQKNLKLLREEAGLTQTEIAEKIGVTKTTVCLWETGRCFPRNVPRLAALAEIFGVTLGELIGEKPIQTDFVSVMRRAVHRYRLQHPRESNPNEERFFREIEAALAGGNGESA